MIDVGAVHRRVAAAELEGFRDAQARAVEQRQHGGVAGEDPGLARLAGAGLGLRHGDGGMRREGARQGLGDLRAPDRREGARGAVALALEVAREGAQRRELAHERAALDVVHAARREECADVERLQADDRPHRRRLAEMAGQEGEELPQVPPIGLDGLRGQPPLPGEGGEPVERARLRVGGAGEHGGEGPLGST